MEEEMTEVVVALIGAMSVILVALVERGRRENKDDHNRVQQSLSRIETKIDGHINDHAKGEFTE
jgi:hypothetical protein